MLKYAIIGFGGLGKVHFQNLLEIEKQRGDIELAAICNSDISSLNSSVALNTRTVEVDNVEFSKYGLYTDYKEMIEKENLDFVFITLPTYLHCEVSVYCMEKGLHVFCEKPMSLTLDECQKMIDTSLKTEKKLMIGHCLRFADEYVFLKDIIDSRKYGKAVKAEFYRMSPLPTWSYNNWLLDEKKSGGCVVDMAAHEIDLINWMFGKPEKICSVSSHNMASFESVFAICHYPDLSVRINVDWGLHSSFKFRSGYSVTFENAHIERIGNKVTIYTDDGAKETVIKKSNSHMREATEFVEAIADNKPFNTADVLSVYESMKILFEIKNKCDGEGA